MARPTRDTIQSGVNGWDATVNDNNIKIFDKPFAIHEHTGDESDITSTFAPASYDNCLVWVDHTVDGWTPYHSDGSTWATFSSRFGGGGPFTSLSDVPTSYSGQGGKTVAVNSGETALEFVTPTHPLQSLIVVLSDETTAIPAAATNVMTFRMPAATLSSSPLGVRISLNSATTTGTVTVDINVNGSTILSTKLTIDATEKTSVTAAVAAVISTAAITDDDIISVDIDDHGDGTATGLKLTLLYAGDL